MYRTLPLLLVSLTIASYASGQFEEPVPLTAPEIHVNSLRTADIDGDGFKDIVAGGAGLFNAHVAWYRNDGEGKFTVTANIISPGQVSNVYVADMDGDGDPDIIHDNSSGNEIDINYNLGDGEFGAGVTVADLANSLSDLIAFDADNDGDQDLFIYVNTNNFFFVENLGNGAFHSPVQLSGDFYSVQKLKAIDLDNDNDTDLVFSAGNKITKLINSGNGSFVSSVNLLQVVYDISAYDLADMNDDGILDIVIANSDGVTKYNGNGSGFTASNQFLGTYGGIYDLSAGDIDHDGDIDIACNYSGDDLKWLENTGAVAFTEHAISTLYPRYCLLEDLNGDQFPELVMSGEDQSIISYHENNAGVFGAEYRVAGQNPYNTCNSHGDVNGDGIDDIIYTIPGTMYVIYGDGSGNFSAPHILIYDGGINLMHYFTIHDLDNDGDMDIIGSANTGSTTRIFTNNGDGTYGQFSVSAAGCRSYLFLDYDNDGDTDFLTADGLVQKLIRNMGNGTFTTLNFNSAPFQTIYDMAHFDVSNDGIADFVTVRTSGVLVNIMTAGGTMSSSGTNMISPLDLRAAEFTDMDGDGDQDVLTGNAAGVIGWYMNTNGSMSSLNPIGTLSGTSLTFIHAQDFDGDGDQDVFFAANTYDGMVTYYENMGGGIYELRAFPSNLAGEPMLYDFFDADNDSDDDLFIYGSASIAKLGNMFESPYQARGSVFVDFNHDGVQNGDDYGLNHIKMTADPGEEFAFTKYDGTFRFNFDGDLPGSYLLSPLLDPADWNFSAGNGGYTVEVDQPDLDSDTLDFGIYPVSDVDSVNVTLTGGFPRCNSTVNYYAHIRNCGTSSPFAVVDLELSPELTYVSSALAPDSVVGDHYFWHYDSLLYFADNILWMQVAFPGFTSMGNSAVSTITTSLFDNDGNITGTIVDSLSQVIVCAYDPNDKSASPEGEGPEGIISLNTNYIDYLIRFQNTGNDTAIRVLIRDIIDPSLNYSEIVPIASSHPMEIEIEQDGRANFVFDHIMLPDSTVNESASHGFVSYRVTLADDIFYGDQIQNTAHIYFDQNPAVVTNTTLHTVERPATYGAIQDTICFSYTSPSGNYTWNTSGIYSDTVENWYAGDSIIAIDLQVIMPASVILTGNELIAQGGGASATWQWISCTSGTIAGATSANFTLMENGSYAVIMTSGECVDTSECFQVTNLEISGNSESASCIAFPNPSNGIFKVSANNSMKMTRWNLYAADGQMLNAGNISSGKDFDLTIDGAAGIYLLRVIFEDGTSGYLRLMKTDTGSN